MSSSTSNNDHYNEVLPGKLFVGDKHAAEDSLLLKMMGVTHIVSCGFEQPLESTRYAATKAYFLHGITHFNISSRFYFSSNSLTASTTPIFCILN